MMALEEPMLHIPFHGFMKITLFMCAGAIYVKTHKEFISEMEGIGKQMPITMAAFTYWSTGSNRYTTCMWDLSVNGICV
ncbi:hypothetical protein BLFGPEAP_01867 [Candidatus Methanoperedenaceae archaeon GB50]|nr:hypothetical protein BLFGPEAP_01867 [Candidatus Methanoperedenaceae archaeon GB50]